MGAEGARPNITPPPGGYLQRLNITPGGVIFGGFTYLEQKKRLHYVSKSRHLIISYVAIPAGLS